MSFLYSKQETDSSDVPKIRKHEVISDCVDRDCRISLNHSTSCLSLSPSILRRYQSGLEADPGSVTLQKEDAMWHSEPSALLGCSLHVS